MGLNKNFFDMDLYEEEVIQEGTETGSMDFDFDDTEDVEDDDKLSPDQVDEFHSKLKEELGQDDTPSENAEADADKVSSANEYEQKYLDQLRKEKDQDPLQKLELAINSKLPKDFAEGVSIFDNNDFANAEIKDDNGKVVFCVEGMFPLKRIISERKANNYHLDNDKLFAIGSDGLGNAIVMNTEDWCYYIWYHDTKETLLIAKAFDNDGVDPGYDISENDTLLGKLGHAEPTTEEPSTEETGDEEAETEEPADDETETEDIEVDVDEETEPAEEAETESEEDGDEIQESYVQESDELSDDVTVGEAIEKENAPEEETPAGDIDIEIGFEPSEGEDALAGSETPEGDDLSNFGTDTSDVQNEYDPKEIEILNKLIAAEGEAINDYFDASKDSHDSNARRLYSDIGHEERFHMEQLLFQKAQFTGEKYEPRDPEVKKEYEELLQLGMDDHTAAATALDKASIEYDGDAATEETAEILEHSVSNVLTLLRQNQILLEAANYMYDKRAYNNIIEPYGVILEQYYQEEVTNDSHAPKKSKRSPMDVLIQAIKTILDAIKELAHNIREKLKQSKANFKYNKMALKEPGVLEQVFSNDINLYFYNDIDKAVNMVIPVQYVDLLYRLSVDIGKKCGVTITKKAYHGTVRKPIKYNSIQDGIAKIKNLSMTKTKVPVNDKNREHLIDEFFGYSEKKVPVKVWNEAANKAIYESNNVYTKLELFCLITESYCGITLAILEVMQGLEGNMNSIYYKDRAKYNECKKNMDIVVKTYSMLLNAATSDLKEMLKLDKKAIQVTRSRDAGNPLPEGEKDRRTSGSNGNNRDRNKYARSKN